MSVATQQQSQQALSPGPDSSVGSTNRSVSPSKVGGGILDNAHEAPSRNGKKTKGVMGASGPGGEASQSSSIGSFFKSAFLTQQAGRQIKTDGKPLGKTFERTRPLPNAHEGAEVLEVDPRGDKATAGDGIILSPTSSATSGSQTSLEVPDAGGMNARRLSAASSSAGGSDSFSSSPSSSQQEDVEQGQGSITTTTTTGSTSSTSIGDAWERAARPDRSASETSPSGSSSSLGTNGTGVCSIRFAPLPTSGRLKRANSITIGVAARSQLLHSQGAGRQQYALPPSHPQSSYQRQPQQRGREQDQPHHTQMWYMPGAQRPDDVIDIGEELKKSATKVWRRMRRGSSASSGNGGAVGEDGKRSASVPPTPLPESHSEGGEEEEEEEEATKTPKRAQSPVQALAKQDHHQHDHTEGPQHDSYHLGNDHEEEGARTPRSSMQRRLSTGAFLGNASLRGMQDKRRRDVLGFDSDDEGEGNKENDDDERGREERAKFAEDLGISKASKVSQRTSPSVWSPSSLLSSLSTSMTTPAPAATAAEGRDNDEGDGEDYHEADESLSANASTDEEDPDDEETREAQQLADEAVKSHSAKATRAGAVEKVERRQNT